MLMIKRIKKSVFLLLICFILLQLNGCFSTETDISKSMRPPKLTERMEKLQNSIDKVISGGSELVFPDSGEYRSLISFRDIDSDDIEEAFCFFSKPGPGRPLYLAVFTNIDGNYKSYEIAGGGTKSSTDSAFIANTAVKTTQSFVSAVDTLDFCDLDNDGVEEIIVFWKFTDDGERPLTIYDLENNELVEKYSILCTKYQPFKLDINTSKYGIFLLSLNISTGSSQGKLLIDENGTYKIISTVAMDSRTSQYISVKTGLVSPTQTGVFVDTQRQDKTYATELILFEDDILVNPLLSEQTGEPKSTIRNLPTICTDADIDDIIEIPTSIILPGYTAGDSNALYLTGWNLFNNSTVSIKFFAFYDSIDKYYIRLSPESVEKISVVKGKTGRTWDFISAETKEVLYAIRVFSKDEWDPTPDGSSQWKRILAGNDRVYSGYITNNINLQQQFNLSENMFLEMLKILDVNSDNWNVNKSTTVKEVTGK